MTAPPSPGPWVDDLGYPTARHPEDPMRELPEADEEWLAEMAAQMWPDDDYAELPRPDRPDSAGGSS